MLIVILRKFIVLFTIFLLSAFGQQAGNDVSIELGQTTFSIDRPFTISVIAPNNEKRVTISFPDIAGFTKTGLSTSVKPSETEEKSTTKQVIVQSYKAQATGQFRLPPFTLVINGESVHSAGATLLVKATSKGVASANETEQNTVSELESYLNKSYLNNKNIKPADATPKIIDITPVGTAFLSLRVSKSTIYAGEGVALTLSFFVADTYPYELSFTALDKQLQAITKRIRPVNSWEENVSITELRPISVVIREKKFREFRLYQSVFFPLSNRNLNLPPVSLQLARPQPEIGPPSPASASVMFTSKPLTIVVKDLPAHPLRGHVPVGLFQLEEGLERQRISTEQSVRYTFAVTGEGNIATLPAPTLTNETPELNVFPPEERQTVTHDGNQVTGRKTFSYFMVPHQNGRISLANRFQWIYFDPQTGRYDTLQPRLQLQVGGKNRSDNEQVLAPGSASGNEGTTNDPSLYAGIETLDSTRQPINLSALARTIANTLILAMLGGMVFVVFKRQNRRN